MVTVEAVIAAMEKRYPVALAAEWDAVGLVCGDPSSAVERVLFAVDPVMDVVDEALAGGVDMIITHHPLLLRGVHSVAPLNHKGSVLHTLITREVALYCAHTNADHARPGVSDALAELLGLQETVPLQRDLHDPVLGTGRVGDLREAMSLGDFADVVAAALPETARGIAVAGDLQRRIDRVAVCGGSGDSLLYEAAAAADVYVTSDLRHHRAQDHVVDGGCALIDAAHWATEWPWLPVAARTLRDDLAASGSTVDVHVSTIVTDPWTAHRGSSR